MNPPTPIPNPVERENNPRRAGDAGARPERVPQPHDPIARRAIVALQDGRIEDADGHLRRLRNQAFEQSGVRGERSFVERTWVFLLEGMVAEARGQLGDAERWFRATARGAEGEANHPSASADENRSPALTARTGATTDYIFDPRVDPRVRALALECLGRTLRRMDDPVRAQEVHRASLEIRERVGSWEECRQSAHELALDASVAGKLVDAIEWHQRAIEFADALGDAGLLLRAETLSHLARVQRNAGDVDAAIRSAQAGLDLRSRLDPSSLETLRAALERAEYCIARAAESDANGMSMKSAESTGSKQSVPHPRSSEDGAPIEQKAPAAEVMQHAISPLDAAIAQLLELRGEFLAWGVGVEEERRRCEEAMDFATRLRASSLLP